MPTIETLCQRDWLPPNEGVVAGLAATSVAMTEWVINLTPDIINGYDARDGDDEIDRDQVGLITRSCTDPPMGLTCSSSLMFLMSSWTSLKESVVVSTSETHIEMSSSLSCEATTTT